jgi:HEPN domain-containing protein
MSDADRVTSFLALAREDLEAARLLRVGVPRQAAFFVQQAAEKIGNALLIRDGIDAARIHAIGQLAAELCDDHPLKSELMALDRLSVYATMARYPSPTGKLPRAPDPAVIEVEINAVADFARPSHIACWEAMSERVTDLASARA